MLGVKRLLVAIAVVVALPVMFGGCQKTGSFPTCKKDADCRVDATGKEINGVCYMGKCEECVADADCSDLKQCVNNRCESACHADADCGLNKHCEKSYCVADCVTDETCPGNHTCAQGRCVAQAGGEPAGNAWASGECAGIDPIYFDFDRYDVKAQYRDQISRLGQCLETNPELTAVIEGHTDDRGTPSYNMALGQKRADAVKNFLKTSKGIASNRIHTVSHGEQKPAVNESTEYAWQQNRRAEFSVRKN